MVFLPSGIMVSVLEWQDESEQPESLSSSEQAVRGVLADLKSVTLQQHRETDFGARSWFFSGRFFCSGHFGGGWWGELFSALLCLPTWLSPLESHTEQQRFLVLFNGRTCSFLQRSLYKIIFTMAGRDFCITSVFMLVAAHSSLSTNWSNLSETSF